MYAPVAGQAGPLDWAGDPAFALLGAGVAILPDGRGVLDVHAPVSGAVVAAHPHALVIAPDDGGAAVLLHLGVDTVGLPEAFTSLVTKGARVVQGRNVIRWDVQLTAARGLATAVVVTALAAKELLAPALGPVRQDAILWRGVRS